MATLQELLVKIGVDADDLDTGLEKSAKRADRSFNQIGAGAGRMTARVGVASARISVLGGSAAAAAGSVVQLAAALAPAAGILTALPAAASAAGAAFGTLKIATAGVGEAMGAALTGDASELATALEGLAPAAQSVVQEVSALRPEVDALRESVQQEFFAPMVGQLERVGGDLLPVLTQGMTQVSSAMGNAASEALDFAGSAQGLDFLDDLFDSTATAIGDADGAIADLLSGFTALAGVGLPFVEDMGGGLAGLASDFNDWATAAAESGDALGWIDGALVVFGQLGSIAGNLGTTLGGIFEAAEASGGSMLSVIEGLTDGFSEWASSAEGIETMTGVFEALNDIGSALVPVIASIVEGVGQLAGSLAPGITAVLDALGEGLGVLTESGALEMLGSAFGDVMTALTPLLPTLREHAAMLAGVLAEALIAIAPSLQLLAEELAENLAPVLPTLAEAFTELIEAIAPLLPQIIDALLPVLPVIIDLVELMAAQFSMWAAVIQGFTPVLSFLIGVIGMVIAIVAQLISWIINVITAIYEWGANVRQNAEDMGRSIARFRDSALDSIGDFLSTIAGLPGRILSAIGNLGSLLWSAGADLIRGLIDGVQAMIGSLQSTFSGITSMIPDWKGPRDVDLQLLTGAGEDIMTGLTEGIQGSMPGLRRTLQGVTDGIPSSVSASVRHSGVATQEQRVVIDVTGGEDALINLIRGWVREYGGGDVGALAGGR